MCALVANDQERSPIGNLQIQSALIDMDDRSSPPDKVRLNTFRHHLSGFRSNTDDRKL
ncbi:hypothetical protein [Flagellimonas olearia]|uniref:hypothetical protein n=1 Tax=Flagellimonas olearia TaxID=552546 RepID=UPI0014785ED0|nr:hypothetical protein [Allomuricauda olearia]